MAQTKNTFCVVVTCSSSVAEILIIFFFLENKCFIYFMPFFFFKYLARFQIMDFSEIKFIDIIYKKKPFLSINLILGSPEEFRILNISFDRTYFSALLAFYLFFSFQLLPYYWGGGSEPKHRDQRCI